MANLIAVSVTKIGSVSLDTTTTYQLSVDKIRSVTPSGSGAKILVEDEGGHLEKKVYTVTETPSDITTAANA